MLNYYLLRPTMGLLLTFFTLIVPLFVTVLPLISVIWLARSRQVRESVWLLCTNAVLNTGLGLITTLLAMMICGGTIAYGTTGNAPECNMGPVLFMPIGIFFTILTFLTGLYFAGERVVITVNESASQDWY